MAGKSVGSARNPTISDNHVTSPVGLRIEQILHATERGEGATATIEVPNEQAESLLNIWSSSEPGTAPVSMAPSGWTPSPPNSQHCSPSHGQCISMS